MKDDGEISGLSRTCDWILTAMMFLGFLGGAVFAFAYMLEALFTK